MLVGISRRKVYQDKEVLGAGAQKVAYINGRFAIFKDNVNIFFLNVDIAVVLCIDGTRKCYGKPSLIYLHHLERSVDLAVKINYS